MEDFHYVIPEPLSLPESMKSFLQCLYFLSIAVGTVNFASAGDVKFRKVVLTDKYYCDGIHFGDFNRDGKRDIVAGPFWYEGPTFKACHEFYPAVPLDPAASPSDSMFSFVYDFNGDGWDDILTLGRVHKHPAYWRENPRGEKGPWRKHFVFERVRGESPIFEDVNGDGRPELLAHWDNRWGWIAPDWRNPKKPWAFHPVSKPGVYNQFYHGEGVGDLNGDGRRDILVNEGWWVHPATPAEVPWTFNKHRFGERGGAQMYAYDVDGDGDNDVISSLDGHGWGLSWFEQVKGGDGITFRPHPIMGDRSEEEKFGAAFSQVHALDLADMDGDGLLDIVTGKRRWAHGPNGDVEPNAPPVLYWFQLVRENGEVRFVPHQVDDSSGTGVQITAVDVNGNGATDILTVSKLGTFVFLQ